MIMKIEDFYEGINFESDLEKFKKETESSFIHNEGGNNEYTDFC